MAAVLTLCRMSTRHCGVRRLHLAVKNHARVIQDPVAELPVSREAGVIDVLDVVTLQPIPPLVGTRLAAPGFIVPATG
ncbi:hypothetical protein D3C84_821020 [compost metagenome]